MGKSKGFEYWRKHIEVFRESGLNRNTYCQQNNLRVSTFDYWRSKLKKATPAVKSLAIQKSWINLQIAEGSQPSKTGIRMRIGRLSIEVERGFDPKTLAEVFRIAGSVC